MLSYTKIFQENSQLRVVSKQFSGPVYGPRNSIPHWVLKFNPMKWKKIFDLKLEKNIREVLNKLNNKKMKLHNTDTNHK